ncbi:helix-turn-helix transcriptional regulator [Staphylococcus saprophyticus]
MVIKTKVQPYNKIKSYIALYGLTQKQVADDIGISRSLLNIKINRIEGRDFSTSEAKTLADYLGIKVDDFFELKVSKTITFLKEEAKCKIYKYLKIHNLEI